MCNKPLKQSQSVTSVIQADIAVMNKQMNFTEEADKNFSVILVSA